MCDAERLVRGAILTRFPGRGEEVEAASDIAADLGATEVDLMEIIINLEDRLGVIGADEAWARAGMRVEGLIAAVSGMMSCQPTAEAPRLGIWSPMATAPSGQSFLASLSSGLVVILLDGSAPDDKEAWYASADRLAVPIERTRSDMSGWEGLRALAWMPLPEPFRP